MHVYDIINLSEINCTNSIKTKMSSLKFEFNENFSISTVAINNDLIENLSSDDLLYWLYYFQKYLLCTKLVSFNNLILKSTLNFDCNEYLQPQIILEGKTLFNMRRK